MPETLSVTDNGIDLEGMWPIPAVYLLHGKGGSPDGTVKKLVHVFEQRWPGLEFRRLALRHCDPIISAEQSLVSLAEMDIPVGALLVGVSLGGLLAAKLQESGREDLKVIAISSPTWADGIRLEATASRRQCLALYSSTDEIIAPRTADWPKLASLACDCGWLTHATDEHIRVIARFFDWCLEGNLLSRFQTLRQESSTKQETDQMVWKAMAERRTRQPWREGAWSGGRPQTFAEMGPMLQSGSGWEIVWGDWLHEFIDRKDARCLASEPPSWFPPERRAMLAGTAEFFAKLYGLPLPAWTAEPEYFLPEPDYYGSVISFSGTENALLLPETETDDLRLRAKTPKAMLRRNVIFAARSLTVL